MKREPTSEERDIEQRLADERWQLLRRLDDWLETPMMVLGFVWLALFIHEVVWGLNPLLEALGYLVWGAFVLEFVVALVLAPRKLPYVRANWLKALALAAPALRVFRVLSVVRAARATRLAGAVRGLRLLRVVSALNRGMRALAESMGRRGFGYVAGLTLMVTLAGAAGMYAFESENPDGRGLHTYGSALWWTAMVMTTMGSEYWPQSPEGRVLCFLLSLYALGILGYVAATLATFFIGRDAEDETRGRSGAESFAALRADVAALRDEIRQLARERPQA